MEKKISNLAENSKFTFTVKISFFALYHLRWNDEAHQAAKQLTKFIANVVTEIAQPQVCYPDPKQDMLDSKSSMCRKISNVAKTILGVNLTGKDLFESIGSLSPLPPSPPQTIYIYEH